MSLPGVFAAGDVRQRSVKRVASAVGEGSVAATNVSQYLQEPDQPASKGA
jgi:thioredoxin reductase (NADPH)